MSLIVDGLFPYLLEELSAAPLKVACYGVDLPLSTEAYSTSGECSGSGYAAGGFNVGATWELEPSGRDYSLTISPLVMAGSFYVASFLLYRADTGKAISVMPTGGVSVNSSGLTVNWPAPLIRIQV